jgi:autotransporter passenger strand-loop-strand repeat protein
VSAGGKSFATIISKGGIETVRIGGIASGTHVVSSGTLMVSGGKTFGAIVSNGGVETVFSGGVANGTTVLKGGRIVYAGGTFTGVTVSSGSFEAIAKGTTVKALQVGAGVTLTVSSGATASATTLSGGTEIVASGGKIGGAVTFAKNTTKGELEILGAKSAALKVSGFAKTDTIDLAGFAFKGAKLSFVENKGKTQGTLTITDGALTATVTLFGQYVAGGFKLAAAGAGTAITYVSATAGQSENLTVHQG